MKIITRGALIKRLRRDCAKRNERIQVLRAQKDIDEFGEIMIIDQNNVVVAYGDLKNLASMLLREHEVLA